jgi:cyanate lyase
MQQKMLGANLKRVSDSMILIPRVHTESGKFRMPNLEMSLFFGQLLQPWHAPCVPTARRARGEHKAIFKAFDREIAEHGHDPRRLRMTKPGLAESCRSGARNDGSTKEETTMNRAKVTEKILSAKRMKELTWAEIARKIGGSSQILLTAACLGQMKMTKEQATKAAKLFGLGKEETLLLQEVPYRGSLPQVPPTDPLIYRFYELVQVYGTTWKELIQEEFGDGIMSAIDFDMTMERLPDQKGDRVKLVMSGKFLGYKTY